ncbi:hypothetical protein PV08_03086 [Exophiala spinifera]|uniref:Uncharacterized protein n=1 Tax=Exophiala spinifera TaxID=91928 RepID=A0A0D2A1F3_9EURO|nr:uncharacterized protein PV08_03086 [Exophiala spinifera]KIW18797.1 hypothetical protein PV08_03086 [Exophiala spinifera]
MYRKRNGSLGFSFTRFAHAAVPNFFADESPVRTANLISYRRDMCYMHQIASPDPYALDERSFYVAGVVDSESVSRKVHRALKKCSILGDDGIVDTHKIGPRFPHQLALLNIPRQKDLVGMLFWWEEECQRLRKLNAEEEELDELIAHAEVRVTVATEGAARGELREDDHGAKLALDELKFARERVRMKKRQRPSQRRVDVEEDKDDIVMAFHGRSKSVPNMPGQLRVSGTTSAGNDDNRNGVEEAHAEDHGPPPGYLPRT